MRNPAKSGPAPGTARDPRVMHRAQPVNIAPAIIKLPIFALIHIPPKITVGGHIRRVVR